MAKRDGAPRERAPKRVPKSYVEEIFAQPMLSMQFGRIGANLTPARISAIINRADMGFPASLVDLFHECRQKVGHLHSVVQSRELGVARLNWDLTPPYEKPKKRDLKAAAICKAALKNCSSLTQAIEHFEGEGTAFGHATVEVIWRKDTTGNTAGYMVPEQIKVVPARRFGFRRTDGALVFDPTGLQNFDGEGVDLLAEYPVGKFIQYTPRVNGDVMAREGMARMTVWMASFQTFGVSDWLQLAEIAWRPKRVGTYAKEAPPKDRQALLNILERLNANGVAIHPEGTTVTLHWPQTGRQISTHRELIDFLNRELSKGWLGSSDVVEPGEVGARSAVQVRDKLRGDIRDTDAVNIGKLLRATLVTAFYRLNWGETIEPAEFFPILEEPLDLEKFSKSIHTLRQAGFRIPDRWVREKTGIPTPGEGEEILGDGEPIKPKPAPGKPADDEDDDTEDDDKSESESE